MRTSVRVSTSFQIADCVVSKSLGRHAGRLKNSETNLRPTNEAIRTAVNYIHVVTRTYCLC
jgi:hypothetical protein